jgi:hypothetical protein
VLLCCLLSTSFIKAQDIKIKVSVQSKAIEVNLEDVNEGKVIKIASENASQKELFIICNKSWKSEKDMDRSFMIYNEKDIGLLTLSDSKQGKYTVTLKNILEVCKKGNSYGLYTTAIPKDPAKAAVVRVARMLVCKVEVQ